MEQTRNQKPYQDAQAAGVSGIQTPENKVEVNYAVLRTVQKLRERKEAKKDLVLESLQFFCNLKAFITEFLFLEFNCTVSDVYIYTLSGYNIGSPKQEGN